MVQQRTLFEAAVSLLLVAGIVTESVALADLRGASGPAATRAKCDVSRACRCATERSASCCCRHDGESPATVPAEIAPVLKWASWTDQTRGPFVSGASQGSRVHEDNHFHAPNARSVQSLLCIWRI